MCHLPKFDDPNLIVGFDQSDDAAVYKINDDLVMIKTLDLFPPMVDDPYNFGQIAAANALSDVYAMGGTPKLALNILCYPEDMDTDTVKAIMQGGYEKVIEAGAVIGGGHSLKDHEPKYGLSVTGFARPEEIITNSGAKPGDVLILTKALGTGILATAAKENLLRKETLDELIASMARLNKDAATTIKQYKVSACTDVTGFGLAGHGYEMANGSGVTLVIDTKEVPLLPEAKDMAMMGIIPAGAYSNRAFLEGKVLVGPDVSLEIADILFDPQTSGGLLVSLPEAEGLDLLEKLRLKDPSSAIIGRVAEPENHAIELR